MYTSTTIAYTTSEIRPVRQVEVGPAEQRTTRTVRVTAGRSNARRKSIADSLAGAR